MLKLLRPSVDFEIRIFFKESSKLRMQHAFHRVIPSPEDLRRRQILSTSRRRSITIGSSRSRRKKGIDLQNPPRLSPPPDGVGFRSVSICVPSPGSSHVLSPSEGPPIYTSSAEGNLGSSRSVSAIAPSSTSGSHSLSLSLSPDPAPVSGSSLFLSRSPPHSGPFSRLLLV